MIEEPIFNELKQIYFDDSFKYSTNTQGIPEEIFKFRKWRVKSPKNHDDSVIEKLELHFANPDEFVDKDDCKIIVNYVRTLYNIEYCKKFRIKLLMESLFKQDRLSYKNFLSEIPVEALNDLLEVDDLIRFNECDWKKYIEFTGILSMTKNSTGKELWEKHAKSFTGVCYGFDTEQLFNSINLKVDYSTINHVNYFDVLNKLSALENNDLKIYQRKFSKLKDYEWEDEYRLTIAELKLDTKKRNKIFNINCVSRIIFGYKMTKRNFDYFLSVLKDKNGEFIPLFVAKLKDEEVIIESLDGAKYWS